MKVSRLLIKIIKMATLLTLVLAVTIPAVTTIYRSVVSDSGRFATSYFSLSQRSVTLDHFYARSACQSILSCIDEYVKKNTLFSFKTEELYKLIKDRYQIVKEFDCCVRVPMVVEIHLVGVKPYCLINNTYVLGDKNCLFSRDLFTDFDIDCLPKITINPQLCTKNLSEKIFEFLHKIPQNRWRGFAITYKSPSQIELSPVAARCGCLLVVDEDTFFDDAKFNLVGHVFDDMVKKGFLLQKTLAAQDPHMVFDLRFDQRVVVGCKDAFNKRGTGL